MLWILFALIETHDSFDTVNMFISHVAAQALTAVRDLQRRT